MKAFGFCCCHLRPKLCYAHNNINKINNNKNAEKQQFSTFKSSHCPFASANSNNAYCSIHLGTLLCRHTNRLSAQHLHLRGGACQCQRLSLLSLAHTLTHSYWLSFAVYSPATKCNNIYIKNPQNDNDNFLIIVKFIQAK